MKRLRVRVDWVLREATRGGDIATQPERRRRPRRSREDVSSALIEAASALFAERPAGRVTVRDIAARADCNPALINRYFGSRENLLRAVVRDVQTKMVGSVGQMPDMVEGAPVIVEAALREREFIHLVARATIDAELGGLASEFPALQALVHRFTEEMRERGITGRDPRMVVACLSCLTMGYVMFGDFVRAATGLTDEPDEEVRAAITETLRGIAASALSRVQPDAGTPEA